MKQFENLLIISDFDGTFAGKDGRIIPENCEAIKHFIGNGGHFSFASGRSPSKMKELFQSFREFVNAPMIAINGAVLYDPVEDKVIDSTPLDAAEASKYAVTLLKELPEASISIIDGEFYTSSEPPVGISSGKWDMMTCVGEREIIDKAAVFTQNAYDRFCIRRPSPTLLDMTAYGINKGVRIELMRNYFAENGMPNIKIYCVGDYENDIDMLKVADAAFCPSNAIDDVKRICAHVLCDHDDGAIADLITKIENNEI